MSIENTDFREEVLDLENPLDIKLLETFLTPLGFSFSTDLVDYSMIIYNLNDQIVGSGSYQKNVLKFVAVAPQFRETPAFAQIVTHLSDEILKTHITSFVYTRPESAVRFEGLGFTSIATAEPLFTVLEMGYKTIKNYMAYLEEQKRPTESQKVAALVINGNPFTNGHKFLIETAAAENEVVYLFVVQEDRSIFDFKIRWKLIEQGIAHLNNVVMIKGSQYVISGATFPSYFLKNESVDLVTKTQAELDITIFSKYFVPLLGIKKRYVGTENYCKTTAAYNQAMQKILPAYDVELIEVQRKACGHENNFISASKVRQAIKDHQLEKVMEFLPESTKQFLLSDASIPYREKIQQSKGRH